LVPAYPARDQHVDRKCPFQPRPVPAGDPASFDAAIIDLSHRVVRLAPRLAATS
jgi:hypothetical protein